MGGVKDVKTPAGPGGLPTPVGPAGSTLEFPGPDDAAHDDGLLMHELTVVNSQLGRYVLRFLDADAGRVEPIATADERTLADRLTRAAQGIRSRAARREQDHQR